MPEEQELPDLDRRARTKYPKPETKRAKLISMGLTQPTFTPHRFVETRVCELPGPGGGLAYEFIFECMETSMQRRWGTQGVDDQDVMATFSVSPSVDVVSDAVVEQVLAPVPADNPEEN